MCSNTLFDFAVFMHAVRSCAMQVLADLPMEVSIATREGTADKCCSMQ